MDDLYDYRLMRVREDGTIIGPAENVGWPVEGTRMRKESDDLQLAERVIALRSDVERLQAEVDELRKRPLITAGASARINYGYCSHCEHEHPETKVATSAALTLSVDELKRAAREIGEGWWADRYLDKTIVQARKNRAYDNIEREAVHHVTGK